MIIVVSALVGTGCTTTSQVSDRPARWAQSVDVAGVPNLYQVDDGLYRSAQPTAEGLSGLEQRGIRTVLSLRKFNSGREEATARGLQYDAIPVKVWSLRDEDGVRFLRLATDPNRRPVLLYCKRGADRTGAMVALYRVAVEGWTKEEAIREMVNGGYGFSPAFLNLIIWVDRLDVEAIRLQAGLSAPVTKLPAPFATSSPAS